MSAAAALDWRTIDLVIFDVDGTLYDQRQLRLAMLKLLLRDAWQNRSLDTLLTLRTFRRVREALGEQSNGDFLRLQYAQTASQRGKTPTEVRELTTDWLEVRPLPLLAGFRYPHVAGLFDALRAAGKQIAVFSDYPAGAKLAALGLDTRCLAGAGSTQPLDLLQPGDITDAGDSDDFGDSIDLGDFWLPGELGELDDVGDTALGVKTSTDIRPETRPETKPEARSEALAVSIAAPSPAAAPAVAPTMGPIVCATDTDIGRLKPDPAGLLAILRLTGVPPERALMIGDRFDRDGVAAERAGVRCLIRGRKPLNPKAYQGCSTFTAYDDAVFKLLQNH